MTAAVGASAMASASQPWRGKTGTLTAKARRKASEASQRAAEAPGDGVVLGEGLELVGRSKVPVRVEPEHADEEDGGGMKA